MKQLNERYIKESKMQIDEQWTSINKLKDDDALKDWEAFKVSPYFYRITTWDPATNGLRYLKILLYNLGSRLTPQQFNFLSNIKNRTVGNPNTVTIEGEELCYDYLQSVYEITTLFKLIDLNNRNILEIGAGYGRTCHAILSNAECRSYTIVDLEERISVSRPYLKKVLDSSDYEKITFTPITNFDNLKEKRFDLTIQIDGFNEMVKGVVENYINFINTNSLNFYVKNPVGKYRNTEVRDTAHDAHTIDRALNSGIITDFIDINNNREIAEASRNFTTVFKPSERWELVHESWAPPVSHCWESFFKKINEE
ncbi:MAG: putative sugar O-methyltransferase [Proteobacteria bacterium]|nr:putative sugar O-methyltransferase [Pseudomonadota bacterium]